MILSLIIVIGHGALLIRIMMSGRGETVQSIVTEPGGIASASTLT